MSRVRTRFAPSPTGYLHIGGLRTALYAYLFAKKHGGDFILRLEDTDRERFVDDAAQIIYRTLKDVGLNYDEGPDVGGDYGPYVQSDRNDIYRQYAHKLVDLGAAYYCFCDKDRLAALKRSAEAKGTTPKYDKRCLKLSKEEAEKRIAAGEPYVIRQNIPEHGESSYTDLVYGQISVPYADMEDNILLKSDGYPTYNLANVIDDHLMGITHVIRGAEYLSSTPKYNLLYEALGWEPPQYIHLPPVMRDSQHKLSKRYGDASYEDFIDKGYLPQAIINYIALLGWSPGAEREIYSLEELTEAFNTDGLSKSPAIFDEQKLKWMNGEYIRAMDKDGFMRAARPYIAESANPDNLDADIITKILQPRTQVLTEIPEKLEFLRDLKEHGAELYSHKKMKVTPEAALESLIAAKPVLENLADFSETSLHEALMNLASDMGVKNGQLLYPLRIAITGREVTPGGAIEAAALLGKEETLRRLDLSTAKLDAEVSQAGN